MVLRNTELREFEQECAERNWEGRRVGPAPLNIDRAQVVADGRSGVSLTEVAKKIASPEPLSAV